MTEFILNGENVVSNSSETDRLLDVLRYEFGDTGVKCACREGECGACSVLLDGKLVNSCLVALGAARGSEVITIEGFAKTEPFKVIEKAFADQSAVQCGFCTPGMILAAHSLLTQHPHPSTEEIKRGISGNICRCTGYDAIIAAVRQAAEEGDGLW